MCQNSAQPNGQPLCTLQHAQPNSPQQILAPELMNAPTAAAEGQEQQQ
jgi:hypothetical protein